MSFLARTARSTRPTTRTLAFPPAARRFASTESPNTGEQTQRASPEKSATSPVFYGVGAVLAFVCGYYMLHSDKTPASGHTAITQKRREGDPSNEYRDPRDSGVKTLEQKKAKEEGRLK